jgi:hypothetical protein
MTRRDLTIPGDLIATNKTKQNKTNNLPFRDRSSTWTYHTTHRWLIHKLCLFLEDAKIIYKKKKKFPKKNKEK